jgi:glycosyltransferase involved in cell wall biosynthesis
MRAENIIEAIPSSLRWLVFRLDLLFDFHLTRKITEWCFLRQVEYFEAAYPWTGISTGALRKLRAKGKPIFLERINCFTGFAKEILDDAYSRLGLIPQHGITPEMIRTEFEDVQLSDFIFCPSPWVKESFLKYDVPEEKLILSSYGWCTKRFPNLLRQPPTLEDSDSLLTILFVGHVCVRKGAHLLMHSFLRSGVKGRLILCGRMEPVIADICKDWLHHPGIIHQPYTRDLASVYREADLFAFPTLEEGGPQVTYEAMAHGLPVLVSPMGAGSIARHGIDGWVVPPYDEDAWIESIRQLADSPELRWQFSQASWQRACEFTYEQVANRRAKLMLERLAS